MTKAQQHIDDFINIVFPIWNKNLNLMENDKEIHDGSEIIRCEIVKSINLTEQEYDEIGNSLLDDRDIWENIGGSCEIKERAYQDYKSLVSGLQAAGELTFSITDSKSNKIFPSSPPHINYCMHPAARTFYAENFYTKVVQVTANNREPFYVNTEGYSYARYVGRAAIKQ